MCENNIIRGFIIRTGFRGMSEYIDNKEPQSNIENI